MSWECVRDLNRMYPLINLIHDLANRYEAPESIIESAQACEAVAAAVRAFMDERGGSTSDFERRWDDLGF